MKILFLIQNEPPVDAVSSWRDIKQYKDKGLLTPSKDYYSVIKVLEKNPKFEKEILLARQNIGINKSGINWKEYYFDYYLESLSDYSEQGSKKYRDFFSRVKQESKRINKKFKLEPHILSQLENIIIGGFVFPDDYPITHGAVLIDDMNPSVGNSNIFININHKITKNGLITYIENNWKNINLLIKSLPHMPNYYVSKRDLRMVELKDKKKLSWDEIIKKITDEFGIDDLDGELNNISAPRAYNRAKKRIDMIANYKTTSDK